METATIIKKTVKIEIFFYIFIFYSCLFIFSPLYPMDDYWRHVNAYKYNYDYSQLYIHTYLPKINLYIGYDILLGFLHKHLGESSCLIIMQILILGFYTIGYFLATNNDNDTKNEFIAKLFFYVIMFCYIISKIISARPVVFVTSIFLILWFCNSRILKIIVSVILAPFYWLFFLYVIPLILKEKYCIVSAVIGFAFWGFYDLQEYLLAIKQTLLAIKIDKNLIAENVGWTYHIFAILVLFCPFAFLIEQNFNKTNSNDTLLNRIKETIKMTVLIDYKTMLLICFYFLPNQVRYIDILATLIVSYIKYIKIQIKLSLLIIIIFFSISFFTNDYKDYVELKKRSHELTILKGKKIISNSSIVNYYLVDLVYPIKVSPSMEARWMDKPLYDLFLKKEIIDCDVLKKKYDFDYVVDNYFTIDINNEKHKCLTFEKTVHILRIFKVMKNE